MTRRRKSNDAGGGILLLLMIAAAIAIFLVKLFITILLFSTVPALIVGWLATWRPRGAPVIEDPARFDDDIAWREIAELSVKRQHLLDYLNKQYESGFANGLDVTAKSDRRLFHAGSKLGKQLNYNIELGFIELGSIRAKTRDIKLKVFYNIPDWRSPVDQWLKLRRMNFAFTVSVITFLASSLLLYFMLPADIAGFTAQALLWNPDPGIVVAGPVVIACGVTTVVFIAVWQLSEERGWESVDHEVFSKWRSLEVKWNHEIEDEAFNASSERPQQDEADYTGTKKTQRSSDNDLWHQTLNVSENASPEEIKQAYKQAIKQYHPDRVSGLGERLLKVAEEESKRINAAFAEAKQIRGFS